MPRERLHRAPLRFAEGSGGEGDRRRHGAGRRRAREEIGRGDLRPGCEQQRLLDGGAELAHVALPRMRQAGAQRLAGERLHLAPEALGGVLQEMIDQQREVLAPLDEWRGYEVVTAEEVVEVLAEPTRTHRGLEVLV